jgi:hypothetical protein
MPQARDYVNVAMPNVLRDRIAFHRLHHRMALHEVIEEAVDYWESCGAWTPFTKAPVDTP